MSTCISSHGEYGSHTLDDAYTCTRCHVLDEETLVARFRQLRTERDALWTAASHLVDLTNRNGSDLLVGHAIALLGQLVEHMPEVFPAAASDAIDYARGVTLGREVLAILAQAGYAVVKVTGAPVGTGADMVRTELRELREERDALRVGVDRIVKRLDLTPRGRDAVNGDVLHAFADDLRAVLDRTSITGE